jgi:hypothetical protein
MAPFQQIGRQQMTKFNTSDRSELSVDQISLDQLDTVVGGSLLDVLSPQLRLAATPVGPVMRDVFAKPVLGQA